MSPREIQLLQDTVGDAEPRLCLRSKARIDAGRWWRRTPVWLCVMADEIVMLAVGRRRYAERVRLDDCGGTHYNQATGELVFEPGGALRFNRFALAPREALKALKLLKTKGNTIHTETQ